STELFEAPSISMRSGLLPVPISRHDVQAPHGSAVGPCSQLRARASARAAVVFPTPRAPVNRKAWWMRPPAMALRSVRVTCSCPTISSKVDGRYFRAMARYDTCSSSAAGPRHALTRQAPEPGVEDEQRPQADPRALAPTDGALELGQRLGSPQLVRVLLEPTEAVLQEQPARAGEPRVEGGGQAALGAVDRSEEHTSELQS